MRDADNPSRFPPDTFGPTWRAMLGWAFSAIALLISVIVGLYVRTAELQIIEVKKQIEQNAKWNREQDQIDYVRNATVVQIQGQLQNDRESIIDLYKRLDILDQRLRAIERIIDRYLDIRDSRTKRP